MDSATAITVLTTLLVLHQVALATDFLPPLLSPVFDNVCKEVKCGKGKCKPLQSSNLMFECECEPGWKHAVSDRNLRFLPCVVPNCTFDLGCGKRPATVQRRPSTNNSSFHPCKWTDCGAGSCNRTSDFSYTCDCAEGAANLLNVSFFPCFRKCALGMDCKSLGLSLPNTSSPPSPPAAALSGSGRITAALKVRGNSRFGIMALIGTMALLALRL